MFQAHTTVCMGSGTKGCEHSFEAIKDACHQDGNTAREVKVRLEPSGWNGYKGFWCQHLNTGTLFKRQNIYLGSKNCNLGAKVRSEI